MDKIQVNENVFLLVDEDSITLCGDFRHFGVFEDGVGTLKLKKETARQLINALIELDNPPVFRL